MFLIQLISRLPLFILYVFSDMMFFFGYYVVRYRRKVVRDNLAFAFPEKSSGERNKIEKEFYRNLTDSFAETIKLLTISREELARRFRIVNGELILSRIEKGEIVIGLTAHFFNWEMHLMQMTGNVTTSCDVVYRRVKSPFFEKLMMKIRGRFGVEMVERDDFQRIYLKKRNKPRLIVLAADQRPPKAEIRYWATFMNRETFFFEGGEKLAKRFHHITIYAHLSKPKRGHYVVQYQLLGEPPYEGTQEHSITDEFIRLTELNIHDNPSLYLWSHNRWKIGR